MQASPRPHRSAGFSLIELLTVLVILGLVAGLGLPSFLDVIARNRVVSQHNEILAGLSYARAEAIRRNVPVALCAANAAQTACQVAWDRNWLVWQDTDADGVVDAGEDVLQVGGTAQTEQLSSPSGAAHTVFRFSARGLRLLPDPDAVAIASLRVRAVNCPAGQSLSRTITILRTGATRSVEDPC